jgi:hypothetical protein
MVMQAPVINWRSKFRAGSNAPQRRIWGLAGTIVAAERSAPGKLFFSQRRRK